MKLLQRANDMTVKAAVNARLKLEDMLKGMLKDERGDTNFISIIIILGIVILLVVVFRGYITDILKKVSAQVAQFSDAGFK